MKENVRKICVTVIYLLAIAACFAIWPLGFIAQQETEQTGVEYNKFTESLTNGVYLVQPFVATQNYLQDIVVVVDKNHMTSDEGNLQLQLMDESGNVIATVLKPVSEIESYKDITFCVNSKLKKGANYSYSLQGIDTKGDGLLAVYRTKSRAGTESLGNLSYFGLAELPDAVSMVRLVYKKTLAVYQIVAYDAFFMLLATLCCYCISSEKHNPLY